ncbi:MAG: hypothetical protein NVSMB31_18540 [Vulcanimicrobiaceae bacterium]
MSEPSEDLAQVWKLRYERLARLYGLLSEPSPDYQDRAEAALHFAMEQLQGQFAAVGHLDRGLHVFDYFVGARSQSEAMLRAQWNHLASKHLAKTQGISVCSNTTGQPDLRCDERNCGVGSFVASAIQYGERKWLLLVGSLQPRPTTYTDSDELFIQALGDFFVRVLTQRESRERIATKAYYDGLTRAVNRHGLLEYLTAAIAAAQRGGHRGVLLYMDLNGFKHVNDTFGHKAGDVVLREFADRIRSVLRAEDFFARLGGDEFAVVMPHVRTPNDVSELSRRITAVLRAPFRLGKHSATIGAAIGAAYFPEQGANPADLLANADAAMYKTKDVMKGGKPPASV